MEGLRYLPFAREDAVLVVNRNPVRNVASYPDLDRVLARVRGWRRNVIVDAEALAREAGTHRAVNSVMLGTASPFMILGPDDLAGALGAFLARRGADVVAANLRAFAMGRDAARAANV
jgi:indolepyruvate ferredoxin oxidoreductase beta subunit